MYKIICDRCGVEYGQFSELYQLERGHYRITRYEHEYDEILDECENKSICLCPDCEGEHRSICLCPDCEGELDKWLQLGIPKNFTENESETQNNANT